MTAAPGPQQPDEDEQDAPLLVLREGWQNVDPQVTAEDLHAQWHDEPGNLMGKDECGWQCDVWDPIWHMLLAALAARPAAPSAQPDEVQCPRTIDCEIVEGGGCWTHRTPAPARPRHRGGTTVSVPTQPETAPDTTTGLSIPCITQDPKEPVPQRYLDVCTKEAELIATSLYCPADECGGHPICRPCYELCVADGLVL